MIQRVYRTAPAIQSAGFRQINRTAQNLANDFGLSDINTRGGDGGLRTDWQTRRNTQRALEMMGHGERSGMDMGQYFKPVSAMSEIGAVPGALVRDPTTNRVVATDGMGSIVKEFGPVVPRIEGNHDGRDAGLPAGD
jgi:hypothetical protein